MIETFRKIWQFAGDERANINKSVWVSFLSAVLQMFQVGAIYLVVLALTRGEHGGRTAWLALVFELISIFDEATANVDPENEDRLQKAIEALTHEKTVLMIAHRLKTVRGADQILVVDGGQIVQQGRHDELIRQPGIYADFVGGKKETTGWKL